MENNNKEIKEIAVNSLDCIESVADWKNKTGSKRKPMNIEAIVTNTFNNQKTHKEVQRVNKEIDEGIEHALPIARVSCKNKNGDSKIYFITRFSTPHGVPGKFIFANSKSRVGRLASLEIGDELEINEDTLIVESSTHLHPHQDIEGKCDSENTEIAIEDAGKITVPSLIPYRDSDGYSELEIVEGTRRKTITSAKLRDQEILDKKQDDIFRMPINSQCFLFGPPGTGKTTTLIRRLAQKTDYEALKETGEINLVNQVEQESEKKHSDSWLFFSPTELLRVYLKEAFARERIAATSNHVRTWREHCQEIARQNLGLLATATKRAFILPKNEDKKHLKYDTMPKGDEWYSDFKKYLENTFQTELLASAQWLVESGDDYLVNLGEQTIESLNTKKQNFYKEVIEYTNSIALEIENKIKEISDVVDKTTTQQGNVAFPSSSNFSEMFREKVQNLLAEIEQDSIDEDIDFDAEEESEKDSIAEDKSKTKISEQRARQYFVAAIKALAKSKFSKRKVSEKTMNGMLLAWLQEEEVSLPSDDELLKLGEILTKQRYLRKFYNIKQSLLNRIVSKYKSFRKIKESRWYNGAPEKNNYIHWAELDILVLAWLQIATEISSSRIQPLYRAQIFVDEATDFSPIQLACMYELSHPLMRSFFMCGDVKQRLTKWGIDSNEKLKMIAPNIETIGIITSYRQSQLLVDLAKAIAKIKGGDEQSIKLPDDLKFPGIPPVWKESMSTDSDIATWLAQRIKEIESQVTDKTEQPTIAVLTNGEELADSLADELDKNLQDISLNAVHCKDGKDIGKDGDVRVFNMEHIKGLEFEAAFFVGLDETIKNNPDLWWQYLYVGATRAAKYLGITFSGEIPEQVKKLADHFASNWQQEN